MRRLPGPASALLLAWILIPVWAPALGWVRVPAESVLFPASVPYPASAPVPALALVPGWVRVPALALVLGWVRVPAEARVLA